MSDDNLPARPEPEPAIPIDKQLDSLQVRVAVLEAQQNWLHLEQLRAEVAGLRKTVEYLVEYIAERDGASVARTTL